MEETSYWIVGGIVAVLLGGAALYIRHARRGRKKPEDASNIYPLW